MRNILEKIGVGLLKGVIVFLGTIVLIDVFIVINELLGNQELIEKIDNFIVNFF